MSANPDGLTDEESIAILVAAAPPLPEASRKLIASILGPRTAELMRKRADAERDARQTAA